MNKTTNIIICGVLLLCNVFHGYAQEDEFKYRRSSMYSLLINHEDQKFANEIKDAFIKIPVPDKFNDHDLSVKILTMDKKLKDASSDKENETITDFLQRNNIASRLVGKWFNRDKSTGECDMNLVKERGLYDATKYDLILAEKSARSSALLMDAGEELIGNTYVVVNDIRYIDKAKTGKALGGIARVLGAVASAYTGINFSDLTDNIADMAESYKGFKVKINTFLYRLTWNEEIANRFYIEHYSSEADEIKCKNFENSRNEYTLTYVGKVESSGSSTSFLGINEAEPIYMVRKACQRAIDENIVSLQNEFEEFRIKTPLVSNAPLTAYIGMKEGVTEKSLYEVLETIENEDGTRQYKRVGIIKPVKNLIWDNRFMAEEEGAATATLGYTTFIKESGSNFLPGMLIREIKSK